MTTDLGYSTHLRIGLTIPTMQEVKIEPLAGIDNDIERVVSGQTKAVGSPRIIWRYTDRELTGAQFYQLKNLVGDAMSATVYVDVPVNNVNTTTYTPIIATYMAIMQWPAEGVVRTRYDRWAMPDIVFTNIVAV